MKANVIVIHPGDNVAVALEDMDGALARAEQNEQGGILCLYALTPAF